MLQLEKYKSLKLVNVHFLIVKMKTLHDRHINPTHPTQHKIQELKICRIPLKVPNVKRVFDVCVFVYLECQKLNIEFSFGELWSGLVVSHLSQKPNIKNGDY